MFVDLPACLFIYLSVCIVVMIPSIVYLFVCIVFMIPSIVLFIIRVVSLVVGLFMFRLSILNVRYVVFFMHLLSMNECHRLSHTNHCLMSCTIIEIVICKMLKPPGIRDIPAHTFHRTILSRFCRT